MSECPAGEHAVSLRIGWIGFHVEGLAPLRELLQRQVPITAVVTLDPVVSAGLSGAADYEPLCGEFGVPLYFVRDINDAHSRQLLRGLSLDVAFLIGWTQMVSGEVLRLTRMGMIGAHASLLPDFRGHAPVNWALILGLTQTGNSLIWLAEGADRGDIIDQTVIRISPYDTCASLYERVAHSNAEMIVRLIPQLLDGHRPGRPQPHSRAPALPRRRPADGVVDWSRSCGEVYDFIRALTRPYPGALSWLEGRRYRLWEAALLPGHIAPHAKRYPGEVTGAVVSPRHEACGVVVACGKGSVMLLELEDDEQHVLTGRHLSEQRWEGKQWRGTRE